MQEISSATAFTEFLFQFTGQMVLDDEVWQLFGFKGRPKRGRFSGLVDAKNRMGERFLLRELLCSTIAWGILSLPSETSACLRCKIAGMLVHEFTGSVRLVQAFGFSNTEEAYSYLGKSVSDYMTLGKRPEFHHVFVRRGKEFLGEGFRAEWLWGCARLFTGGLLFTLAMLVSEQYSSTLDDDLIFENHQILSYLAIE